MNDTTKDTATAYLMSLINKRLRVHATDGRIFVGNFKCTDTERNVVLSATYEYRQPALQIPTGASAIVAEAESPAVKEMPARHLGLIVVPGEYIVKIELEEFLSQAKPRYQWNPRDVFSSTR